MLGRRPTTFCEYWKIELTAHDELEVGCERKTCQGRSHGVLSEHWGGYFSLCWGGTGAQLESVEMKVRDLKETFRCQSPVQ